MSERTLSTRIRANQKSIGNWITAWLPVLLLAAVIILFLATGAGMPSVEGDELVVQRVTLPERNVIMVDVINPAAEAVTIAQVLVDEAYWDFQIDPGNEIPRLGSATIRIPYPWVEDEDHEFALVTDSGALIEAEVSEAAITSDVSASDVFNLALIGFYFGLIPIGLGMWWQPYVSGLKRQRLDTILALTIGLLTFLLIHAINTSLQVAADVPGPLQGLIVLGFGALAVYLLIHILSARITGRKRANTAQQMALVVGLRCLAQGLAVGAAYAMGATALGIFLVVGFALYNIIEGSAIATAVIKTRTSFSTFARLTAIAALPAIAGVLIGGLISNDIASTFFLGMGIGAIMQAIVGTAKQLIPNSTRTRKTVATWANAISFALGLSFMYLMALLVVM